MKLGSYVANSASCEKKRIIQGGTYWSFGNRDKVKLLTVKKCNKIFGLSVKLKNVESKLLPKMRVTWEEKVCKCDKHEVQSSW